MFQSFRNQKRWLMLVAMILIIPAFVFIGINGYSRLNPDANAIAKVDGKGIQPEEFDQAKRQFIENRRAEAEGNFDPSEFDTAEVNHAILYRLTTQRALNAEMQNRYVQVGENDAIAVIKSAPAFQKDGRFEPQLYENFLAARGKSDQQFVYELRGDLAREMLINGVKQTVILPKTTLETLNKILREERVVRTMAFSPDAYLKDVKVTEEDVKAFYDKNAKDFTAPESLNIEYVVLSADTLKLKKKPNEDELLAFYEQNKTRYGQPETRRASHILITPDADEKDAAKADAAAKAKAESIFAEVKAHPDEFADYAKKESADTGSAEQGGDVDYFGKGQMVPAFENAVFQAKKGDIVGPVKSEYGYHIIKVTDVVPSGVKPFAEVKPEIVAQWEARARQEAFAESADNFANMVYEQSDSLQPAAEAFGLKIQKADGLTRSGFTNKSLDTPYINKRVIEELFSSESINEKRNIQSTEVASGTLVSARVVKHIPAHQLSFDEVKDQIQKELQLQKASALAQADGEKKLAALREKADLEGFSPEITVSRLQPNGQAPALVQAEMEVPPKSFPAFTGTKIWNGSYVISYVISSKVPSADDAGAKEIRGEALTRQSMGDELAYYDALKKLYKLEILKKDFDFKVPKAMN
jgi:peptidyl-prolyl cis-trans isomerase D